MATIATVDQLRAAGEALSVDVARALYEAHAGLTREPDLAAIYSRHPAPAAPDALDVARGAWAEAPPDSAEARGLRALTEWVVEARASRALAPFDEREIAWEQRAVVRVADGTEAEYASVVPRIANTRDRAERLALDAARAALVGRELAPMRRDRLRREHDDVAASGFGDGYVATFERLSGVDLRALAASCDALLGDSAAMWDDVLPTFARRRLGVAADELTRADALALFRAPEFDAYFPAGAMLATARLQMEAMGVDAAADGRVRYDVGDRPGKRARAFCAPVRVPDEVYLVLRPQGGAGDWRALLHELGHALHFGHTRADLPFEARWAGDASVTEGYAMLLDHLMHDGGWLLRRTELGRARVADFRRAMAFEELHYLRRYAAKLRYELVLYESLGAERVDWDTVEDAYVETLGGATRMRYHRADAVVDVDPRFYAARYLRAWQLQAVVTESLRERFDEDWWRNPRTGACLVDELWGDGQSESAETLAARVSGAGLSFAPLLRSIERALA